MTTRIKAPPKRSFLAVTQTAPDAWCVDHYSQFLDWVAMIEGGFSTRAAALVAARHYSANMAVPLDEKEGRA